MIEFRPWPKTARLFRDIVITEKIDGTNACVIVEGDEVAAQSRTRIVTPGDDNFGFAKWVTANAESLKQTLGEGYHYGEYWGSGIQRGYGLPKGEKRFSLFNHSRWGEVDLTSVAGLGVVPCLYRGVFDEQKIDIAIFDLRYAGSLASPGFDNPEGVVIYHTASNSTYKVTCKDDEKPKGQP